MNCELIMKASEMESNNAEWLKLRQKGIGGSDASVILGMNQWKSPYQLWLEKTGEVEPEDISKKETVHFGHVLEQVVADEFCNRTGKKVKRCGVYRMNDYPFIQASFDRLVVGEDAGLECKTTNSFARSGWDEGEIPPSYYVQCQHYMLVSGLPRWYIACLVGGNHFVIHTVERDEEDIKLLLKAEINFWHLVENHIMPEVDGSASCKEALARKYQGGNEEVLQLPAESMVLAEKLDRLKESEKSIKEQIAEIQNKFCAMLGDYELGTIEDGDDLRKVKWQTVAGRVTIDSKRLKADHPDIFKAYSKQGKPTRRFSI